MWALTFQSVSDEGKLPVQAPTRYDSYAKV